MLIVANATGETDGPAHSFLSRVNSSIPIVLISKANKFVFNQELLKLEDWVCVDFVEMGWNFNWERGTHLFGKNTDQFQDVYLGEEWKKFDAFVKSNPPALYFKRELLKRDVSDAIKPIEYPSLVQEIPIQIKEAFNARPICGAYYFGRSHELRLKIHSDIWAGAIKYGYSVCDNIYYFNGFMENEYGKKYVSMHIPHYSRHPIENILAINGLSKIGIAPHGAGIKTFRTSEVPVNAAMLMWEDELAWSQEWTHGINCLRCKPGEEVGVIEKWLNDDSLYSIYINGVETCRRYNANRYISEYIEPAIKKIV